MSEVTVHVGGHVTLLFSIHSNSLLSRNQGSKGAGFCLEDGVEVSIRRTDNETDKISVTAIDGSTLDGGLKLYSDLIESFRELFQINERIDVDVRLELPISQGFGMSAAGLLATSLCPVSYTHLRAHET